MTENDEQREQRWREIQRRAETVRQVHPARRLPSEDDMLWLMEEVRRLRRENERLRSVPEGGGQASNPLPKAA